jgi:hypothetical protein
MIKLIRFSDSEGFREIEQHDAVEDIKISDDFNVDADYIAKSDFYPTYSAWSSVIGNASTILTVWEHADQLIGNNHVAFLNGRSMMQRSASETWDGLLEVIDEDTSLGIASCLKSNNDLVLTDDFRYFDLYSENSFDVNTHIWDMIRKYDAEAYNYAFDSKPRMIIDCQFMCTRQVLDVLGYKLLLVVEKMKVRDTGMWTEKFVERLLGIYLAQLTVSVYTTAFWCRSEDYAVRPSRFLNVKPKVITMNSKKL